MRRLSLALALIPAAAGMALAQTPYKGHGVESVPPEVIARYAPKPLPPEVAARIQTMMDVRAPGMGVVTEDGSRLFFGWSVTGTPQVWRLDGPDRFPVQLTGGEDRTSVAGLTPDGRFVIGWHSFGSFGNDFSNASVQLRGFDAGGAPFANELQANTYVTDNQHFAALTADGRGGLVAAWESYGSPGDDQNSSSIQARRFSLDLLFADGFESGDAGAWSLVLP